MIPRALNILNILNNKKSVLLLGPRGVGKTALINHIIASVTATNTYSVIQLDLLQGGDFARYIHNPAQLTNEVVEKIKTSAPLLVIIDEVQKIPALLDEAHSMIEKYKGQVIFFFSGSSARKLKRGGANLLAGRAISQSLFTLTVKEFDLDLTRALQFGTLPGIYLDDSNLQIQTLETYVSTYLREEIQQESLVRRIERFAKFIDFAAQQNGQPVNFAKIGKQLSLHGKTVAEYYSILSDTLVAHEVPGWSESVRRQLLMAPKYYLFDCGVLNAINGHLRSGLRAGGYLYGNLFETFLINQIIAINHYASLGLKIYYWRDKDGHEVDLILARNAFEPLTAIEIKSSSNPNASDCPGFKYLIEDYPKVNRICLCNTPRAYAEEGITFLPWREIIRLSELV